MADLSISNLFNVNGMVFVITGGGSGLGESMALALDKNGASKVFILGRREASLKAVANKAVNGSVVPVVADVSSKPSMENAVEQVEKNTSFVNVVIANGGILGPLTNFPSRDPNEMISELQKNMWELPLEEVRQMIDINVLGVYFTFTAFLHLLDAGNTHSQSRGKADSIQSQFISCLSIAAFSRLEKVSHFYASQKAALAHLTKILQTQFAHRCIRVNGIAPGLYLTEMTEVCDSSSDWGVQLTCVAPGSLPLEQHPAMRAGSAEDIAGAILFLVSKAGAFINGNMLLTDGGALGIEPSVY
ncbi:short chain dehydrogenase/reductase family [Polyplosphaeria fusca]|uniref:Short chain dehydrogenase/reductase family n=1 Tax=Polyplosphaeria fusca TaxID=682080 RepID=A0A9P4V0Z4_9PLEO|nr:short chain dehydrogenase/reductase family [Polyplosphaeria fusca]